jgi:lambda repressor-like predicted transcriptional regulator
MDTVNNITTRLRERGITLAALADELGVTPSTLSLVAAGKAKSHKLQVAIADKLDSTVDELWPGQVRLRRSSAEIAAARNRAA